MDIALIEHAENDVDGDQRRTNQHRLAAQRTLECLCIALKGAYDGARHADLARGFPDCIDRLAERDARGKAE